MKPSIAEQIAATKAAILCLETIDAALTAEAMKAVLATLSQHEALEAAIRSIGLRARSDGLRTFDDVIRDIGWIDDECRRALAALDAAETDHG